MVKKFMIGAVITALLASGALAQSSKAPVGSNPPATTPNAAPQASANAGKADFVLSQKPDQWLASNFKGTEVMSADNKKVGDVSDILFDKTGKIEAYIVSIGGFLGMGGKEIAIAPSSFDVIRGQNGKADVLKLALNQGELKEAKNFKPYNTPRPATVGSGIGSPARPGAHPSTNTPPNGQ